MFEIHVKGQVPAELVEELGQVTVTKLPAVTVFTGRVPDQAALFGFLARFHALGLEVVEVRSLHDPEGTPIRLFCRTLSKMTPEAAARAAVLDPWRP